WLGRLPLDGGAQLRRRRRWLERQPGFRIEVASAPAAVGEALEVLFRLHAARWAIAGGSEGIAGESVLAFHREAAAGLAARGWARIYLLHAAGDVRAALYGWERGGRFSF